MRQLLLSPATPRLFVIRVTLAVAILQALWIAVVPPFRASDEFDHAYRAAAVADGQWRATEPTKAGRGGLVRAPQDLVLAAEAQCSALGYTGFDNCHSAGDAGDGHVWVGSGAASYNPLFYWVIGEAAQPFKGAAALYAMRIASSVLCLVFVALSAWALGRTGRLSWGAAGLVFAMSPVFLFSASMAAPNGLEMCSALAVWAALLALRDVDDPRTTGRLLAVAVAGAVVLAGLRMLGPLFLALILVLCTVYQGRAAVLDLVRRHPRTIAASAALVGTAVLAAIWWTLSAGLVNGGEPQGGTEWAWTTIILWPLQTIAAFPFRDIPGPIIIYPIVGLSVGALVVMGLRYGQRGDRVVLAATILAAFALPVLLTAATKDSSGVMWQGRYGLPLNVGFVLMAGLIADRRSPIPVRRRVSVPVVCCLAVGWCLCYLHVRSEEFKRAASTADHAWVPPWTFTVIVAVAGTWFIAFRAVREDAQ